MKGNFVAKHMNTFNRGGSHTDRKQRHSDDFDVRDELDELDEGWDFKIDEEGELDAPTFFRMAA